MPILKFKQKILNFQVILQLNKMIGILQSHRVKNILNNKFHFQTNDNKIKHKSYYLKPNAFIESI